MCGLIVVTANGEISSEWARSELERAEKLDLIPEKLKNADLTKNITRAEFAALSVNVYEKLTGIKTIPSSAETFADTEDEEVLKAHNTGLMIGISENTFEPESLLTREQAATAMTRVLKRAYISGWKFSEDQNYTLVFKMPKKFADDKKISGWAYESDYFMTANGIILGTGDNNFSPKSEIKDEKKDEKNNSYANATIEQAIVIGLRLTETFKNKPIDYTDKTIKPPPEITEPQTELLTEPPATIEPTTEEPTTEEPTTEIPATEPATEDQNQYIDPFLIGRWEQMLPSIYNSSGALEFKYIDYTFDRYGQMVYRCPDVKSYTIEAKYKAYGKKIYLTDVYYSEPGGVKERVSDKTLEYLFETRPYGAETRDVINIGLLSKDDNYVTNNSQMAYFTRKY
jgi:hypothetical protein